jgi:hypothetical protein
MHSYLVYLTLKIIFCVVATQWFWSMMNSVGHTKSVDSCSEVRRLQMITHGNGGPHLLSEVMPSLQSSDSGNNLGKDRLWICWLSFFTLKWGWISELSFLVLTCAGVDCDSSFEKIRGWDCFASKGPRSQPLFYNNSIFHGCFRKHGQCSAVTIWCNMLW